MKIKVLDINANITGDATLDASVFDVPVRSDILARVVDWQLAKRRAGAHKTKTVSEISGSTKKIYKQKGTGNARHGSKRQVQFRGGSVCFGPLVRSHAYSLLKKVRKLGLKMALSAKQKSGDLIVFDSLNLDSPKTRDVLPVFKKIGAQKILFIDADLNDNFIKAIANVHDVDVLPQIGANVYDILKKDKIILTLAAVKALEERLR